MVLVQTLLQHLRGIVLALDQRLARHIVLALNLGRVEHHVVGAARGGVHSAARDALHELAVGHIEGQHGVDLHTVLGEHLVQLEVRRKGGNHHLSLRNGSGETVQNESLLAGGALDVVLDDVHHNIIADKLTVVHGLLGTKTVLRSYSVSRKIR